MPARSILLLCACLICNPATFATPVQVKLTEGIPDKKTWKLPQLPVTESWTVSSFGLATTPKKYSSKGHLVDRSNPFLIEMTGTVTLPAGQVQLLLRARGATRLYLNDKLIAELKFRRSNGSGHEHVPTRASDKNLQLYPLPPGSQEKIVPITIKGGPQKVRVETIVGGARMKNDIGELIVGISTDGKSYTLLGSEPKVILDGEGWWNWTQRFLTWQRQQDRITRAEVSRAEREHWNKRHAHTKAMWQKKALLEIPKVSEKMPVNNAIDRFIGAKLEKHKVTPSALTTDLAFLRRLSLDTVGVIPSAKEIQQYLNDPPAQRRQKAIERLLADDRWADHQVPYWQDARAENPGILKPMLNNTGPFRFWIYDAMLDNLPMDRFASELIQMEGSKLEGGPAGFAMATQNDVPMAAKSHVVARAFLGVEMGCARCHDSPHHPVLQKQTFELAAMLAKKPLKVPSTSSVKLTKLGRKPLIEVTLKPGSVVKPSWPFPDLTASEIPPGALRKKNDQREKLAALITSPSNERFPQVIVNRLWARLMGKGIVEPVDDWSNGIASHPELLDYLARELVLHDYDLKHVAKLIFSSHAYQREAKPQKVILDDFGDKLRLFASPERRRLSAEQIVDSLFALTGKDMNCEELTMDPEGRRDAKTMLTLGRPRRAWEFTSLSNERDRPALALPIAQSIVDLLKAYGWRASRPNPISERDETPTPLQPLLLANGTAGSRITRLSDDSDLTELCLEDRKLPSLIDELCMRILTRKPTDDERAMFAAILGEGYADRRPEGYEKLKQKKQYVASAVSWSNHLSAEATRIKMEMEHRAREGDPPTKRLHYDWRERMEDVIWSLVNSPEMMFVP